MIVGVLFSFYSLSIFEADNQQWELTFLSNATFRATKILATEEVGIPVDRSFQSYQNPINNGS